MAAGDSLEPADSARVLSRDPAGATLVFPLRAWYPGAAPRALAGVRVIGPADTTLYRVPLRMPVLRSVLPADTAGVRPRPPRGLIEEPRTLPAWVLLAALLGTLALAAGAALLWRRRGSRPATPATPARRRWRAWSSSLGRSPALATWSRCTPRRCARCACTWPRSATARS